MLGGPRGERVVKAEEFFVAYRKTALGADELLLRVGNASEAMSARFDFILDLRLPA